MFTRSGWFCVDGFEEAASVVGICRILLDYQTNSSQFIRHNSHRTGNTVEVSPLEKTDRPILPAHSTQNSSSEMSPRAEMGFRVTGHLGTR